MPSTIRRTIACFLALAAVATLAAVPAQAKTRHYPSSVTKPFLKTCKQSAVAAADGKLTSKQATAYCKAALACIEKKLTLKQFKSTVLKMQSGERNPNAKVLTQCGKSAAEKFD